jgi:hypothetical protein
MKWRKIFAWLPLATMLTVLPGIALDCASTDPPCQSVAGGDDCTGHGPGEEAPSNPAPPQPAAPAPAGCHANSWGYMVNSQGEPC